MPDSDTHQHLTASGAANFQSTHWSVVLAAGQVETLQSAQALDRLCRSYWYPLYAFLRRQGRNPPDAEDLTQSFLAHLLENHGLQTVDRRKGKFRSFLLASLKNFLANDYDHRQALKRGAQFVFVSIDDEPGEDRFRREPSHEATPDKVFEQSWALAVLETTLKRLKSEHAGNEKSQMFEALQVYLSGDKGAVPYAEMATRLNLSEGAVKMSVLRLRRRFGELLREEVAQTVSSREEVDEEIRCLFAALGR